MFAQLLLARGDTVVGLDNLNDYYDPALKHDRLARLTPHAQFEFVRLDVADRNGDERRCLPSASRFDRVMHLAAQAGVRYSLQNPASLRRRQPGRASSTYSKAAGTAA